MPGPQDSQPIAPAPVIPPVAPTVPPAANLPPGATSEPPIPIAEKVIGAGITATPNMASIASGDPWLVGWSGLINVGLDHLKQCKRFPERLTPFLMIAVSLFVGWLVYDHLAHVEPAVAWGKGAWIATQAHLNWTGGKRLGILAPTDPANKFGR